MSNNRRIAPSPQLPGWQLAALFVACAALILAFKFYGVLLAVLIIGMVLFINYQRPISSEALSLRTSVELSLQDIEDVVEAFDSFRYSNDAQQVADRTLYRPELLNEDSTVPAIEAFYFYYHTSVRFVRRVRAHLASDLPAAELESLLGIADKRAFELQQRWTEARRAAAALEE